MKNLVTLEKDEISVFVIGNKIGRGMIDRYFR